MIKICRKFKNGKSKEIKSFKLIPFTKHKTKIHIFKWLNFLPQLIITLTFVLIRIYLLKFFLDIFRIFFDNILLLCVCIIVIALYNILFSFHDSWTIYKKINLKKRLFLCSFNFLNGLRGGGG